MERQRKYKTIGIIAVIVAVLGLTIAFAALSQTLTINGSGSVAASSWDIVWEKITGEDFEKSNNAITVDANKPSISQNGQNLDLGTIVLRKPNDTVTYLVNIANNGDINGEVVSIDIPSLNGTIPGTQHTYSQYIDIDVTNSNGSELSLPISLAAGAKHAILITVRFNDIGNELFNDIPQTGIPFAIDEIRFTVNQATNAVATTTATTTNNQDVWYDITFNDLSQVDVSQFLNADQTYLIGLQGEDKNGAILITKLSDGEYLEIQYVPDDTNIYEQYSYDFENENWIYFANRMANPYGTSTVQSIDIQKVKILSESETAARYSAYGTAFPLQYENLIYTKTVSQD